MEDALATLAIEGLHDHLPTLLGHERLELVRISADPRRRHEIGELGREQLLVEGHDRDRAIQDDRLAADVEDLGRDDVVTIDRRIFSLKSDIDFSIEIVDPRLSADDRGVTGQIEGDRHREGADAPGVDREIGRIHVEDDVSSLLGLAHHHDRRRARHRLVLDRVHHEGEGELRHVGIGGGHR